MRSLPYRYSPVVNVKAIVRLNARLFRQLHGDWGQGFVAAILTIQKNFDNIGQEIGFPTVAGHRAY